MVRKNCSKVYRVPRRPYEKHRLDSEMQVIGEYGLKNKREIWKVEYALAKVRHAARSLLVMDHDNPYRILHENALLDRLMTQGLLEEGKRKLEYVLGLKVSNLMERRLQTMVFKQGLARSIHHARVLIRHRHVCVNGGIVTSPSFMVRVGSERYIQLNSRSPLVTGVSKKRKTKQQDQ